MRFISLFVRDEGGYTTVAVATALLASISLVFGLAVTQWTLSRSADVQEVADASALAAANVVGSYCTIAQVIDACVLSMGLAGMATLGAGLVASAVPGAQTVAERAVQMGERLLSSRRRFARSASSGLSRLEKAIPLLCAGNAASCARANGEQGMSYAGCAVPFPLESRSDFSSMRESVDADGIDDAADRLQEATQRADEAKKRANDHLERAWRADCVDDPSCLSSRASSLAGMGGMENPVVDLPTLWDFGMPIERSRTYYGARYIQEAPDESDIESITDSIAREAYYGYALDEVDGAYYHEEADGHVSLYLPHLAKNSNEVRETRLYTDASWPCTYEDDVPVLHSTLACPGALGEYGGTASVADVESGAVGHCDVCKMDVGDLGRVASISTIATNGYEHYWQIIVEESEQYEQARNEQADAERDMREAAEEGKSIFDRALEQLSVPRPRICPPGAWGCVSVVKRGAGTPAPSELVDSFLTESELPAGAAISAAALAPDDASNGNDVLSRFFDGVTSDAGFSVGGLLGGVTGLWGKMLVSYGSSFDAADNAAEAMLERVDGVFGGTVGSWLKQRIGETFSVLGLQPADMRAKKPVLVGTDKVLGKAGFAHVGKVRALIQAMPSGGTPREMARSLGSYVASDVGGGRLVIAELPIPGTELSIPLTVDVFSMVAT